MKLIMFFICSISIHARYTLYHSNISQSSSPIFDCLYAHLIDEGKELGLRYLRNDHLIPYCRRSEPNENQIHHSSHITQTLTFTQLRQQNITSQQLLDWHVPIDIAESYEMNENTWQVFHNCTSPWFGRTCQYRFENSSSKSFGKIVQTILQTHWNIAQRNLSGTCYPFIAGCNTTSWPLCLDWREICDGKFDCANEEDERWCEQFDSFECHENEYRCHYGGQCIPLTFVRESRLSIDCLDGSDEQDYASKYDSLVNAHCLDIPTFRCEERCGRYLRSFPCGDGQYISNFFLPSRIPTCSNRRDVVYSRKILTSFEYISNETCRDAFRCALFSNRTEDTDWPPPADSGIREPFVDDIWDEDCVFLADYCMEEWLTLPEYPSLFGYFQLIYLTNRSVDEFKISAAPDWICFHPDKCPALLIDLVTIDLIPDLTCTNTSDLINYFNFDGLLLSLSAISRMCWGRGVEKSCVNPLYFHCNDSLKCISYHRVRDGNQDCYFSEDEEFQACQLNDSKRFVCPSDSTICLQSVAIGDGIENCPSSEDELHIYTQDLMQIIPFSVLCNRKQNYQLIWPMDAEETDETDCQWWPCNNPYTRCDRIWHCPNGLDELNCSYSSCSPNEHFCQKEWSEVSYCLPLIHMFDAYIDDENGNPLRRLYFYNGTQSIGDEFFSWSDSLCINNHQSLPNRNTRQTLSAEEGTCSHLTVPFRWFFTTDVYLPENNETLCNFDFGHTLLYKFDDRFLSVAQIGYFPLLRANYSPSIASEHEQIERSTSNTEMAAVPISYCHRGVPLLTDDNDETIICLCPPSYFGDRCQWQNQRISLTLQFTWRSAAPSNVIFQVMIMLVDELGHVTPYYEQITYIPSRDCDTKFNIYLLYPDRPKNLAKNYSIRVDLFDKRSLSYWTSWFLAIPFLFLPVNRIATQLIIPEIRQTKSCSLPCGNHGQCTRYANTDSSFFCRCQQGYTGLQCDVKYPCNCANDSLCLAPSICVCPLYKFGRHCYLKHSICQSRRSPCLNNGLCIPNDDRISLNDFTCFCTDNYSGDRCQNPNNRIDIQLDDTIVADTSLVLLHFITAFINAEHQRTTFLKKIPFIQSTLTLYTSQSFHIVLVQIPGEDYYLAILREIHIPSEHIHTHIQSDQLCLSIDQLNDTLVNETYLYRTKFYPLICRQNLYLKCFYDTELMCICDLDRFSNCFQFNHSTNYDCQGYNQCENDGQCFQNNRTCPTKSTCVCPDCYYGSKCQFSTKGFLLSLDPILGYHIKPHVSLNQQPVIIKVSVAINIIMLVFGLVGSILSLITFQSKKSRQLGSGNYLLTSSLISLLMIITLTLKFWDLILSQMSVITNRVWLIISCKSLDYLLKVFLASNEWLTACVALERMISVGKGVNFDKRKSKKYSKWVIISVFTLTTLTLLQDPLYRRGVQGLRNRN